MIFKVFLKVQRVPRLSVCFLERIFSAYIRSMFFYASQVQRYPIMELLLINEVPEILFDVVTSPRRSNMLTLPHNSNALVVPHEFNALTNLIKQCTTPLLL